MIIAIVLLVSLGILGASIFAGIQENAAKRSASTPQARRNQEKINLAKAAGALPNRKENN